MYKIPFSWESIEWRNNFFSVKLLKSSGIVLYSYEPPKWLKSLKII